MKKYLLILILIVVVYSVSSHFSFFRNNKYDSYKIELIQSSQDNRVYTLVTPIEIVNALYTTKSAWYGCGSVVLSWGDGTSVSGLGPDGDCSSLITHRYDKAGTYVFRVELYGPPQKDDSSSVVWESSKTLVVE